MTVFIIAEAGINHLGDVATAKRMAYAAKECGADAVKYQHWTDPITNDPEDAALLARCHLSNDDHYALKRYCDSIGIEYMCSVFDLGALAFVVGLGVKRIKIPSGEAVDDLLVNTALGTGLQVIVSTGAMTYEEQCKMEVGFPRNLRVLHCVSAYPTPLKEANVNALEWYGLHGLSDHSAPGETIPAVLAVAMGAEIIERHFCLGAHWPYPDSAVSDRLHQFASYIGTIRDAERALGNGQKVVQPSEVSFRETMRRGKDGRRPCRAR